MYRPVVRVLISTPADTLVTEVLSLLGILTEYRHRYQKVFYHVLPILWYHIILNLQYGYLKLVYGKMYYAYICYMMFFLKRNKIINNKTLQRQTRNTNNKRGPLKKSCL